MTTTLELSGITFDVLRKDIKNVYLGVYPPTGRVRISAPQRMSLDTIRLFAISKLGWIKQQQKKLREQERETQREYLDRESHYVWGRRFLLKVVESDEAPAVELKYSKMYLRVRPGVSDEKKQAIVEEWLEKTRTPSSVKQWVHGSEVPMAQHTRKRISISAETDTLADLLRTAREIMTPD